MNARTVHIPATPTPPAQIRFKVSPANATKISRATDRRTERDVRRLCSSTSARRTRTIATPMPPAQTRSSPSPAHATKDSSTSPRMATEQTASPRPIAVFPLPSESRLPETPELRYQSALLILGVTGVSLYFKLSGDLHRGENAIVRLGGLPVYGQSEHGWPVVESKPCRHSVFVRHSEWFGRKWSLSSL